MKVDGAHLESIVKSLNTYRPGGKDTLNTIIRLSDDKIHFSIASRDCTVQVKQNISLGTDSQDVVMKTAIGIDQSLLSSIASEVKKVDVQLKITPLEGANYHTLEIISPNDSFKVMCVNIPDERMGEVVPITSGIDKVLVTNEPVSLLHPAAIIINHIAALCPDNQFKCLAYRKGKNLTFVYVTATTISYYKTLLTSEYENDTVVIDTKTPMFSNVLENILNSTEDENNISIKLSDQVAMFNNNEIEICSSYTKTEKPAEESIKSFESTKDAILKVKKTMLKFRFNSTKMIKTMSKASIMAIASKASKLTSVLPFEITEPKSVNIKFKDAPGEYQTKFTDDVVVDVPTAEQLKTNPYSFHINLPMITSMIGAISDMNPNGTAEIELKENENSATYVIIKPFQGFDIGYMLRLKK